VFFFVLKVIFIFATLYKRHPIGEDSLRQKNSCIFHFPTELHFFSALFCASALKSTAVFRFNHRVPHESEKGYGMFRYEKCCMYLVIRYEKCYRSVIIRYEKCGG